MRKYIENISVLSIFLLFAICSLILMILGAHQYIQISDDARMHFEVRTPMAYITNKVRQNDTYGNVQVNKVEGKDVLIVYEIDGEEIYETWIYEYGGSLRELYIKQGDNPKLDWGMELLELKALKMNIENNLLKVDFITPHEEAHQFILKVRSGGVK